MLFSALSVSAESLSAFLGIYRQKFTYQSYKALFNRALSPYTVSTAKQREMSGYFKYITLLE